MKRKKLNLIGLVFNLGGVILLAFAVQVPILPICNENNSSCISIDGEILKLPVPFENPVYLRWGLLFVVIGFLFQLVSTAIDLAITKRSKTHPY